MRQSDTIIKQILPVVLVDIKDYGREDIARVLNQVSQCGPSVIGLYVVFKDNKTEYEDSALVKAIEKSGRVILLSNIVDNTIVPSHSEFIGVAKDTGIPTYMMDDANVVGWVKPVAVYQDLQYFNFSFVLALNHNPKMVVEKAKTFIVDGNRKVSFSKTVDDFVIIENNNFDCESIRNKIVIFGDLKTKDADQYQLVVLEGESEPIRMHSSVVAANVVLYFLEN